MKNYKFGILWFISLCGFSFSLASVEPSKTWVQQKYSYFTLIHSTEDLKLASIYASQFERAYKVVSTKFSKMPDRILIVLSDETDRANGYATAFPEPLIMIYPTLPAAQESIGDYGNWAYEILVHELTHIGSFSQNRGVPKLLQNIFGSWAIPTYLLPRWFLEGVAVEHETQLTSHGRLRSGYQKASLRSLVKNNILQAATLSSINEFDLIEFPYGSRPYLYGSLFFSKMVREKAQASLELHDSYGGRVPYFLDGPFANIFQTTMSGYFQRVIQEQVAASNSEMSELKKSQVSSGELLDQKAIETVSPSLSSDKLKLAYISRDKSLRRSVQILKRTSVSDHFDATKSINIFKEKSSESTNPTGGLPSPDGPPAGSITRVEFSPDRSSLIYDKIVRVSRFSEKSFLYELNLNSLKAKKVEGLERVREPSYSPNGEWIVFTKISAGKTEIGLWNRKTKTESLLVKTNFNERAAWPSFDSTSRFVVYSLRKDGIDRCHLASVQGTALSNSSEIPIGSCQFPQLTPASLYFLSDRTGVNNIYRAKLDNVEMSSFKNPESLSNSLTQVQSFTVDEENQIVFASELADTGHKIQRWPLQPLVAPSLNAVKNSQYPEQEVEKDIQLNTSFTQSEYSAFSYLRPRYWFPQSASTEDSTSIGLVTGGQDPLQKHIYSLAFLHNLKDQDTSGAFSYNYDNFSWIATLNLARLETTAPSALSNYFLNVQSLSLTREWGAIDPDFLTGFGLKNRSKEFKSNSTSETGPFLFMSYGAPSASGWQISPQSGQRYSLEVFPYQWKSKNESFGSVVETTLKSTNIFFEVAS